MSDLDSIFTYGDGIARYRTSIKVVVYSFAKPEPFYLSDDVYNCTTSKNIKGVGQLNLSILPRKNYLNHIFPNDYVNVYFDKGDGRGWVRTFFGMVDKIEEAYEVSTDGVPKTFYTLILSDFAKAPERLSVVFNPYLRNRPELDGSLVGVSSIGGLLMTVAGFKAMGSPPDVVSDLLVLMFGNKSQFVLPESLQPTLSTDLRSARLADLYNRTSPDVRAKLGDPAAIQELIESRRAQVQNITAQALGVPPAERAALLAAATGLTTTNFGNNVVNVDDPDRLEAMILSTMFAKELYPDGSANFVEERSRQIYNTLAANTGNLSWLDVVDVTTYVERSAIDGYLPTSAIQQDQGPLMSILRSFSNEPIVEMFFDLRPYTTTGGLDGDSYSTDADETGENLVHPHSTPGVKYLPALVMREYPFSTVDSVDAISSKFVHVRTPLDDNKFYFGAIFSQSPNIAGRHTTAMPAINPLDIQSGMSTRIAHKHIDVVTLRDAEIKKTRFSRSDTDHLNLFEVSTSGLAQASLPFIVSELVPIVTPSQILRHGVRRRAITSRYGSVAASVAATSTAAVPPRTPSGSVVPLMSTAQSSVLMSVPTDVPANPLPAEPERGVTRRDLRSTFAGVSSVWPVRATREHISSPFGYRNRPTSASSPPEPPPGTLIPTGSRVWRFHNGIDIPTRDTGSRTPDILACADGEIVAIAPNQERGASGGFAGYGNTVIIKHAQGAFYTLYAHLSELNQDLVSSFRMVPGQPATYSTPQVRSRGSAVPLRVTKGTILGKMGDTLGPQPTGNFNHLHFEVIVPRSRTGTIYPSKRKSLTPDLPVVEGQAAPRLDVPFTFDNGSGSATSVTPKYFISVDPKEFFAITRGETYSPPSDSTDTVGGDAGDLVSSPAETLSASPATQDTSGVDTSSLNSTQPINTNDSPEIRSQVARWALLQDHWYQHNLEYLSGTIECRPAPEIRVGYRLDLPDRNLSFYVEGVSHTWTYGGTMSTVLHVTRGQPNNPFPVYVYPASREMVPDISRQRTSTGRLMKYFITPDPLAVRRSYSIRAHNDENRITDSLVAGFSPNTNTTDLPFALGDEIVGHAVMSPYDSALEEAIASVTPSTTTENLQSIDTTSNRPEVANPAPMSTYDPLTSGGGD